ncbi:MAG: hypothetical protein OXC59_05455 [Acidimicrobiaceae bacterium]|nr:hypothetical protein [Acidimicrobiaceae bacterium]
MGLAPSVVAEIPLTLIGSPPEIADSLRRRRERWGFSYMVLQGGNDLDAFSAVIAELDGE